MIQTSIRYYIFRWTLSRGLMITAFSGAAPAKSLRAQGFPRCTLTGVGMQEEIGGHEMRNPDINLREDARMRTRLIVGLTVMSIWLLGGLLVSAQDTHDKAHVGLMKALKGVKVSLADGLAASERAGTPISGKFELEEGKLQLSVYTMKGDTFSEVIVDHTTGQVAKAEPITSGEDLTAATAQRKAMAVATKALRAAVTAHPGAQAVSITPEM